MNASVIVQHLCFFLQCNNKYFPVGKLQWEIGTGWPEDEEAWESINAPVRKEKGSEAADSWYVTSIVDASEKIDSL